MGEKADAHRFLSQTPTRPVRGRPTIELRKLILRILLVSLALAAIAGVGAVLLSRQNMVIRVMQTGLATALAAALTLPISMLIDRERTRPAGLTGLSLVVAMFLLSLILIWGRVWLTGRKEDHLAATLGFLFLVGVPTTVCVLLIRRPNARVAGMLGVGLGAVTFVSLMIGVWVPRGQWFLNDEWVATGGVIAGIGIVVVAALVGLGGSRTGLRWWLLRGGATCAALVGLALALVDIWGRSNWEEEAFVATSVGVLGAYVNLTCLVTLRDWQRWVRVVTLVAAGLGTLFLDTLVISHGDDLLERLVAACGIVIACGSMAILVFMAWNRRVEASRHTASLIAMTVFCPRCRRKQEVALGNSACGGCGLRMHIRIEEPVCAKCGYLLHNLTSDRCPECGTGIATGIVAGSDPA